MTREEARNRIDAIIAKHEIDDVYVTITNFKDYDALRIARKTLEQEPCEDCISREAVLNEMEIRRANGDMITAGFIKDMPSIQPTAKENLVVEDCISREEVCDYIAEFVNHEYATDRERELVKNIIGGIQHLPSIRSKTELETWEGIHAQVTAPKGTFNKIWNEAEDNDEI